jgi:uroporphyrinogen-III synthase
VAKTAAFGREGGRGARAVIAQNNMAQHRNRRESKRPLKGVRILVGRARHQAGALSRELRKLGAQVLEIPFIEIRPPRSYRPLDQALQNLGHYNWLILTSFNGVEAMWQRVKALGMQKRSFYHLHIAAIGPATRKAIERHGLKVDVVPAHYVAESVVQTLQGRVKEKRVLLIRAKVARDVIPHELRGAGAQVDVVEAYETVVPKSSRKKLRAAVVNAPRRPNFITFTSSSTVRSFLELLRSKGNIGSEALRRHLDGVNLASIGPVTSATLRELDLPVHVEAAEYSIPGLVRAIVSQVSQDE